MTHKTVKDLKRILRDKGTGTVWVRCGVLECETSKSRLLNDLRASGIDTTVPAVWGYGTYDYRGKVTVVVHHIGG